ncbi:MAG: type II toxin-antitoxin system Phd/YefM family antitoxin [Isosphaeraceae bacterium]
MIYVDVSQIQADLIGYLDQVARGEIIVVTRGNEPIAELRPVAAARQTPLPLGLGKGMGEICPSFFDPLPAEILDAFAGKTP